MSSFSTAEIVVAFIIIARVALMFWVRRKDWFPDLFKHLGEYSEKRKRSPAESEKDKPAPDVKRVRSNGWKGTGTTAKVFSTRFAIVALVVLVPFAYRWWQSAPANFTVVAPPSPEWSRVTDITGYTSFDPEDDGVISLKMSDRKEFHGVKKGPSETKWGVTTSLQFQSDTRKPVNVTVYK